MINNAAAGSAALKLQIAKNLFPHQLCINLKD